MSDLLTQRTSEAERAYIRLHRRVEDIDSDMAQELEAVVSDLQAQSAREGREVALFGEVARLRAELDDLRQGLAAEVRTRRLVVVGPDGFERITAEAETFHGHVRVSSTQDGMHAELNANECSVEAAASVFVSAGGNIVGQLGVTEQGDLLPPSGPDDHSHLDPDTLTYETDLTIMPFDGDEPHVTVGLDGLRITPRVRS